MLLSIQVPFILLAVRPKPRTPISLALISEDHSSRVVALIVTVVVHVLLGLEEVVLLLELVVVVLVLAVELLAEEVILFCRSLVFTYPSLYARLPDFAV